MNDWDENGAFLQQVQLQGRDLFKLVGGRKQRQVLERIWQKLGGLCV